MRFRHFLTCLSLLSLSACTTGCNEYDNNEEFARAQLPPYTETGANTLGCVLGAQTWTVLGRHPQATPLGGGWVLNTLAVYGGTSVPTTLEVQGEMTGVRDSKVFYDREIKLVFRLSDTLGGLRLLGADTVRMPPGQRAESMEALDLIPYQGYRSTTRRPVRLLIRKLNRQERIVSGTFSGVLYNSTDSLTVNEGRFDVKY